MQHVVPHRGPRSYRCLGANPLGTDPLALDGLYFQGPDGRAQLVSVRTLQETFAAAGASVQLVVLSACYSVTQADALRAHVDCVVGMRSGLDDDTARAFAIGFYAAWANASRSRLLTGRAAQR
jgi:hypothetical protein